MACYYRINVRLRMILTYVEPAMSPPSLKNPVWYSGALYTLSPNDDIGQPFRASYKVATLFFKPILPSTAYSFTDFLLSRPTKHAFPLRLSSYEFVVYPPFSVCLLSGLPLESSALVLDAMYLTPYFLSGLASYFPSNYTTDGFQSG